MKKEKIVTRKYNNLESDGWAIWILVFKNIIYFSSMAIFIWLFSEIKINSVKVFIIIFLIIFFFILPLIFLMIFFADIKYLRKNNAEIPSLWWIFIAPVYVYKRQYLNGGRFYLFWFYIISNAIPLVIILIFRASFLFK